MPAQRHCFLMFGYPRAALPGDHQLLMGKEGDRWNIEASFVVDSRNTITLRTDTDG